MTVEKFSLTELSALRSELVHAGLDSWQAAELFQLFLAGRGYGVSHDQLKDVASRIEVSGCSLETMQRELESVAMVN